MAKRSVKSKRQSSESRRKAGESKSHDGGPVGYKRPPVSPDTQFPPGQSGNPKGRPTTHDQLRALIQSIAAESSDGKPEWTRIELMIRSMLASKATADRANVLEHGWGKVPQELDIRDWREEARRLRAEGKLTREALMAEREALISELDSLADEFFGQHTEEVQRIEKIQIVNDDND